MKTSIKTWSLLGIPDHQGVMNVGGRLGAAGGPAALRKILTRLKGRDGVHESMLDPGDLVHLGADVSKNHIEAADWVATMHSRSDLSVVVGGGHDHGSSHLTGVARALKKGRSAARIGCINIDAHLDVRKAEPVITSGSPFYLAIENGVLDPSRFIEFGIQTHCNAPELWQYVERKKVQVVPFEKLRHGKAVRAFDAALKKLRSKCDAVVISLDLDAVACADAPGVSAPQSEGFTPSEIIEMMEIAGRDKKVASLGIFELNPLLDIDDRTARLGATAAYHFVAHALRR